MAFWMLRALAWLTRRPDGVSFWQVPVTEVNVGLTPCVRFTRT